jgi:MFS family permease
MSFESTTASRTESAARSTVVKATLLVASSLTVMAGATISPSLPAMQQVFSGVGNVEFLVRLVLTVTALFIVVGAPVAGTLVDRIGRKPVLLGSAVLYGLAGSSGLVLDNLYAILAGRALLGLAVAGVMTSTTSLIADYYAGPMRSQMMGLQAAFMGFGGVVFLTLGGFLADASWRLPFLLYLVGLALAPLVALRLVEPIRSGATAGLGAGDGAGGLPIRTLAPLYAMALAGQVVFYLVPTQLPFYLEDLAGVGAVGAGLAIALSTLVAALTSMSFGRVGERFSRKAISAATFVLLGVGYGAVGLSNSVGLVLAGLAVGGVGVGLLLPNLNTWIASAVPDSARGRAVGGLTTFVFLGQFLSPVVSLPVGGAFGLGTAYVLAGLLALVVAGLIAAFLREGKAQPQPGTHESPASESP